jgi:hypothetical protein
MESVGNHGRKEIVREDFLSSLDRIDFSEVYNPFSSDFDRALRLGLMWYLLCKTGEPEAKAGDVPADDISIVIAEAKRLFQKSIDTGDSEYKGLALNTLDMANTLIKKAYSRLPSAADRSRLKGYEAEIAGIREQA